MPNNLYDFEQAKAEYREFCKEGKRDLPIFALPWYLDAVCDSPDDWRVILYKENGQIKAVFPFSYTRAKLGLWHISNPWQAPRLGIWIDYGEKERASARESYENRIVEEIVSKLPYYDKFQISFDARFQNWQQLYRMGFQQTSYYSYVIRSPETLLEKIPYTIKRKITALEKEYHVDTNLSFEQYWDFFEVSYQKRNRSLTYSKAKFQTLYQAAASQDACCLIACKDAAEKIFSVACVLFDEQRVYSMFHTFDPTTKISTQPLVTLYSIALAKEKNLLFDFEGSMIPGVSDYYSRFDSEKEPYFIITNYSNKYRFLNGLRESVHAAKKLLLGK